MEPAEQTTTTPDVVSFEAGAVVAGRYRLVEKLGEGAMGSVFSAEHLTLGSRVALKFVKVHVLSESEAQARFVKEARLSATLGEASRHITRVFDYGVLPNGTPYLAMELLCGESLAERLERERRLPLPLVEHIVVQLCRALEVAHAAHVVHRDLKPANVYLQASKEDAFGVCVKLLDFGVAKSLGLSNKDQDATVEGVLLGTPRYMSPEHFDSAFDTNTRLDQRADLWSCAAIIYRMLAGVVPFDGDSLTETMRRIATKEHVPLSQRDPTMPGGVDDWLAKAFQKDAENRFQNAAEFAAAFSAATKVMERASAPGGVDLGQIVAPAPRSRLSSRTGAVAIALLLVTLCVVAFLGASGRLGLQTSASASTPKTPSAPSPLASLAAPKQPLGSASKEDLGGPAAPEAHASGEGTTPPAMVSVSSVNSAPPTVKSAPNPVSGAPQKGRSTGGATTNTRAQGESQVLWNKKDEL